MVSSTMMSWNMTQLRTNEKWYQNYPTLLDMSPHAVQWENKVILNKMFVFQYLSTVKIEETAIPITTEQI
jgi:hypothetical protein